MSYAMLDIPPGGLPTPWNNRPPDNGGSAGATYFNPIIFRPGLIIGDQGDEDNPEPGDTQVGFPDEPATPQIPTYVFASGQPLVVSYVESGGTPSSEVETHAAPPLRIYLGNGARGSTIPGSVRFTFRGLTYVDRGGLLYHTVSPTTNVGILAGTYSYADNYATLTDYVSSGSNTVDVISMACRFAEQGVSGAFFRTPGAPIQEASFTIQATTMDGDELTADSDINGEFEDTGIRGFIDWENGLVTVAFGEMVTAAGNESEPWYNADLIDGGGLIWKPIQVEPSTITFGAVVYRSIPVDPALVGVDPVRLPSDGRVLGFNVGTPGAVSYTWDEEVLSPVAGAPLVLESDRLSFIDVYDSSDPPLPVPDTWYTYDLTAGTFEWSDPLNLSGFTLPIHVRYRIQDVALITDVQTTGQITLASPVTHNYPAGATFSNVLAHGNMQGRYTNLFDQQTYDAGEWFDTLQGDPAGATYNDTSFPILMTNDGAIKDRWALVFVSPSVVNVIGEKSGQVLTNALISDPIAPLNPDSEGGAIPYFTIQAGGWGGGWAAGNVLRFNTEPASKPIWLARVTLPGPINVDNDRVRIQSFGNAP